LELLQILSVPMAQGKKLFLLMFCGKVRMCNLAADQVIL
jgi:hypothetical protein